MRGGFLLPCDRRTSGIGGEEKGFPGLGAGMDFMGVKAENLSNKACASRPDLRIMTTLQRFFFTVLILPLTARQSVGRLTGAPLPLSSSAFFLPCGHVTLHAAHRH